VPGAVGVVLGGGGALLNCASSAIASACSRSSISLRSRSRAVCSIRAWSWSCRLWMVCRFDCICDGSEPLLRSLNSLTRRSCASRLALASFSCASRNSLVASACAPRRREFSSMNHEASRSVTFIVICGSV
jgi:hypothetical protein